MNIMKFETITQTQIAKRAYWIDEISRLSGNFGADSDKVEQTINEEIQLEGLDVLLGHLRLCGAIPIVDPIVKTTISQN